MRKIVNFEMCNTCKHFKKEEWEDPCHECLNNADREDNSAPLFYEEEKNLKHKPH